MGDLKRLNNHKMGTLELRIYHKMGSLD